MAMGTPAPPVRVRRSADCSMIVKKCLLFRRVNQNGPAKEAACQYPAVKKATNYWLLCIRLRGLMGSVCLPKAVCPEHRLLQIRSRASHFFPTFVTINEIKPGDFSSGSRDKPLGLASCSSPLSPFLSPGHGRPVVWVCCVEWGSRR